MVGFYDDFVGNNITSLIESCPVNNITNLSIPRPLACSGVSRQPIF
jgi:hypothetical protein